MARAQTAFTSSFSVGETQRIADQGRDLKTQSSQQLTGVNVGPGHRA
jgi:hypothetical protein